MRDIQLFILEITDQCNYAQRHPRCPVSDQRRFAKLDTKHTLDVSTMVSLIQQAYGQCGFRGYVGFHYYCEPTLKRQEMLTVIQAVRDTVPQARFLLWTNGSLLDPQDADWLAHFQKMVISNYDRRNFNFVRRYVPDWQLKPDVLDTRRHPTARNTTEPCLRMFTEFVIDYHGNVHICCMDWQGQVTVGNVFQEPLPLLVEKFIELRTHIVRMDAQAPRFCQTCPFKQAQLSQIEPEIAKETREQLRSTPPDWGAPDKRYKPAQIVKARPSQKSITVPFRLLAIIGSWNEADVIEGTVKNLFQQGCDEVWLVDNASSDDTVAVAQAAGAKLALSYQTDFYQEDLRLHKINQVAAQLVAQAPRHTGTWILSLDADEFPQGPHGKTIREYCAELGTSCDIVPAIAFEHYPTTLPHYVSGKHPADFQPFGFIRAQVGISRGFWKHPLVYYPSSQYHICQTRGMHCPWSLARRVLRAAQDAILIHHVPYREEAITRWRLGLLCSNTAKKPPRSALDDQVLGSQGARKRYQDLDYVYRGQFDKCRVPHSQGWQTELGLPVKHWSEWLSAQDYEPRRWY